MSSPAEPIMKPIGLDGKRFSPTKTDGGEAQRLGPGTDEFGQKFRFGFV